MLQRLSQQTAAIACAIFAAASALAEPVTYEAFGAKGDGKTDDRAAIVAAHKAANEQGLPVRAKDGAVYYVKSDEGTAVVKTDVDFGTAKFVIDDTEVKKLNSPLFSVAPGKDEVRVEGVKSLKRGQKNLGAALPGKCFVHLWYDGVKRYIRYGPNQNNGTAQQEVLVADADGTIDAGTPLLWDYDKLTGIFARPIDERPLVVRGGTFVTVANQAESRYLYHHRGFSVSRSNVRIEGMRHEVTGELDHGAPYGGFISVSHCAFVTVTNCTFTAHKTYSTIGSAGTKVSMGSYDISVNHAAYVSFLDSRQLTDIRDYRYWGLFGSNFCKNLLFDGCEFSRFDAHMGVANATIRNSKLGYMGINLIGFGSFHVENTTVFANSFFNLRSDYGSTWQGDVTAKNCRLVLPWVCKSVQVFSGSNKGTHDFGYECSMPAKVVVDGFEIDDSDCKTKDYAGPFLFGDFNKDMKDGSHVEKFPYKTTEEAVLRNVKVTSGRRLSLSPNPYMFRNTKVAGEYDLRPEGAANPPRP